MNQPEIKLPTITAPLQQHKVQLISKGYSYREIKEDGALVCIFKAGAADAQDEPVCLAPIHPN